MTDTNMQSVGEKYGLIIPVGTKNYQEVPGAIQREEMINNITEAVIRKFKRNNV